MKDKTMKRTLMTCLFAAMFGLAGSAAEKPGAATELKTARAKLTQLREVYTDKHPKVQQQVERVHSLEKKQQTMK
ncbi:MAG TPA: hypothetical protein VMZ27_04385 [Candidatus Saccharimonadales bacterium]|nr:hypothetical protein [Candidatus Saccharimonadales bacterium]